MSKSVSKKSPAEQGEMAVVSVIYRGVDLEIVNQNDTGYQIHMLGDQGRATLMVEMEFKTAGSALDWAKEFIDIHHQDTDMPEESEPDGDVDYDAQDRSAYDSEKIEKMRPDDDGGSEPGGALMG